MIYTVYFVPREGVHPCNPLSIYSKLWPIMMDSVHRLGHKLIHLTDMHSPNMGDFVWRTDVDAATTVYSRDVAWLRFLHQLDAHEQACMIEPDTLMFKEIPPIKNGCDMVLLRRPQKCIPGWFKLGTKRAVPFFRDVVHQYDNIPLEQHVFHGDIPALHRACGIKDGDKATRIPKERHGVKIESREWRDYGFRKGPKESAYFHQFKGDSKEDMLEAAR